MFIKSYTLFYFHILVVANNPLEEGIKGIILYNKINEKIELKILDKEYENMNCTGSLENTQIFYQFDYSETYEIRSDEFTWTQTSSLGDNPYTEEGTYETATTDTSTVYTLLGTTTKHGIEGYREGFISEDENSMSIKVQWDTDNNHIVDSCFKFTFYKVN